ncbi:hypothetical protein ACFYUG_33030, partial [Streptomyces albogriseolus]|uniref:hypothetical protein n=1 Tax=Streptomyces albogriseolus TaxID=1887 RepID=UPI0036AAB976
MAETRPSEILLLAGQRHFLLRVITSRLHRAKRRWTVGHAVLNTGGNCAECAHNDVAHGHPWRSARPVHLGGTPALDVLLALTKPLDVPVGDQADGESEEGLVDVVASF